MSEKRFYVVALVIVSLLILISGAKYTNALFSNGTIIPQVCGNNVSSALGYGEMVLWSNNAPYQPLYWSCDNIADGVCPEDYEDALNSSVYASCFSCVDPDCTGNVSGFVKTDTGIAVQGAVVSVTPYAPSNTITYKSNVTNTFGFYNFQVPTGISRFTVSNIQTYFSDAPSALVIRKQIASLNITLTNGTCSSDCTNPYGRCDARCDGLTFNNGVTSCNFYNSQVRDLCNNKLKGTWVFYNSSTSSYSNFVQCCESSPQLMYYSKAVIDSGKISNLINVEKISKYQDVPVKVVIAYWSPTNN